MHMNPAHFIPAAFLLCLATALPAFGADEKPVDWDAVKGDPARLVELLGHESWNVREEAMRLLEKLGRKARPAALKALKSPDPEVAMRARMLVRKIDENVRMADYRPMLVSQNREATLWSSKRIAVRGRSGTLYVVLTAGLGTLKVMKTADGQGTWERLPLPGFTGVEAKGFSLAVDSKERLHLVVHDHNAKDHFFLQSFDGGKWLPLERFSEEALGGGRSPTVAVDGNDDLHVLWQAVDGETFYRSKAGGTWGAVENLGELGAQTSIEVDGAGCVHAVGGYSDALRYRMRNEKGAWGRVELIDDEMNARHASLAVDAENQPHVAWTSEGFEDGWRIYYSKRSKDRWIGRKTLSEAHAQANQDQYHNPTLALDVRGNATVVFDGGEPDGSKFLYGIRCEAGIWSAPRKLTSPGAMVRNPQLRGSFWPESNRVKGAEDLDLFATEMKEPGFRVLYRRGIKLD